MLEQHHPDKEGFAFSRKGKQLSVDKLVSNLEKLLSTTPLHDRRAAENQQSLTGETIRHKMNALECRTLIATCMHMHNSCVCIAWLIVYACSIISRVTAYPAPEQDSGTRVIA